MSQVARVTGLEPATFGVTGRHSNQLSYTRLKRCTAWEPRIYGRLRFLSMGDIALFSHFFRKPFRVADFTPNLPFSVKVASLLSHGKQDGGDHADEAVPGFFDRPAGGRRLRHAIGDGHPAIRLFRTGHGARRAHSPCRRLSGCGRFAISSSSRTSSCAACLRRSTRSPGLTGWRASPRAWRR